MNQLPLFPHIPVENPQKPEEKLDVVVERLCRPDPESTRSVLHARFVRRQVAQAIRTTYLLALQGKDGAIIAAIDRLED